NGKFRDECLSIEWFRSRREAAVVIETWRQHYNEVRPHSSLQYLKNHLARVVDPRSRAYRLVSRSSGRAREGDRHDTVRSD
ncbi:integrase core domain-containing protein, partial [Paucibacter sp. XJ19-41]|uniref:integrase core domain-containing protein n=1 Tax=Paucibacter sp. XJ19-41 TaxID=2927824 RepID=UPI002349F133